MVKISNTPLLKNRNRFCLRYRENIFGFLSIRFSLAKQWGLQRMLLASKYYRRKFKRLFFSFLQRCNHTRQLLFFFKLKRLKMSLYKRENVSFSAHKLSPFSKSIGSGSHRTFGSSVINTLIQFPGAVNSLVLFSNAGVSSTQENVNVTKNKGRQVKVLSAKSSLLPFIAVFKHMRRVLSSLCTVNKSVVLTKYFLYLFLNKVKTHEVLNVKPFWNYSSVTASFLAESGANAARVFSQQKPLFRLENSLELVFQSKPKPVFAVGSRVPEHLRIKFNLTPQIPVDWHNLYVWGSFGNIIVNFEGKTQYYSLYGYAPLAVFKWRTKRFFTAVAFSIFSFFDTLSFFKVEK